jgi:hypothetical protein
MSAYDLPKGAPLDAEGNWTPPWAQWLTRTHSAVVTLQLDGTTAQRPDRLLWVGRFYYDTDLGMPIWLHAINPVVWHDAAGNPV